MKLTARRPLAALFALTALACGEPTGDGVVPGPDAVKPDDGAGADGKADSSVEAIFLIFEVEGSLWTTSTYSPERQIETQLLYTIGQLNGERSLGRLDRVKLTDVQKAEDGDGVRVSYHARIPVAWGRRDDVPETYTFRLPRDVSSAGLDHFAEKYGHDCVDWGAHDVDSGSMWYYFRPKNSGCTLADDDVIEAQATVTLSALNTTGKYPEYHKVWEDDALRAVAIFGKFESGATSNGDAGISSYNRFVESVRGKLSPYAVESEPAELGDRPGVEAPDVTFTATLPDGRSVEVVALLVDGVQSPGAAFDARYAALSAHADLIVYSGHSGLGANIRALARKGDWKTGQYAVVFMNGCDTYAYVDSALADAHIRVNQDDPDGTRYLDIVTNAMPAPASYSAGNSMALVAALMTPEAPQTYEQIFRQFNASQVVLVTGEEDNEFRPGMDEPDPVAWSGLEESGALGRDEEKRYETEAVPAGRYTFELTGTGDADLYVRVGLAPSASEYDCRPYKSSSDETCTIELSSAAPLHVMVRGYAASSEWALSARAGD